MSIFPPNEKSDMVLVGELRRIITGDDPREAETVLDTLEFWYHMKMETTGQVYWTENHSLMYLSSHLLLLEFVQRDIPRSLLARLEFFLSFKAKHGLAEFLSPVYLPFTLSSLLNLYDYTHIEKIRDLSHDVLCAISTQLLSVALDDASFVSPSARSYARHREKTTGHHISVFLEFLLHDGRLDLTDKDASQALYKTLFTTTFRFNRETFKQNDKIVVSPSYDTLLSSLAHFHHQDDDDIIVTMLWSHGIFIPLQTSLARRVIRFMDTFHLWRHPHFQALATARSLLSCVSLSCMASMVSCLAYSPLVRPYVRGAYLTDASIAFFKEDDVVLASITEGYNTGLPCYQQWPWIVNLAGIPLWCAYGNIGTGGIGCLGNTDAASEMSTSRVMPRMKQHGCVLHASYTPSYCLLNRPKLHMRWPVDEFDNHGTFEDWKWATRRHGSIAYSIYENSLVVVVCDTRKYDICNLITTLSINISHRSSYFHW